MSIIQVIDITDQTPLTLLLGSDFVGLGRSTAGSAESHCAGNDISLSGDPPTVFTAAHASGPRCCGGMLGGLKKWNILAMPGSEPVTRPTAHSIMDSNGIHTFSSVGSGCTRQP